MRFAVLAVCLMLCTEIVALADGGGHECSAVASSYFCFKISTRDKITQGLRQLNLVSGDVAYIEIDRLPVEKCSVQTKSEALPAEAGAAGIFSILAKTVVPASAKTTVDECANLGTAPNTSKPSQADDVEKALAVVAGQLDLIDARIRATQTDYKGMSDRLISFSKCQDVNRMDFCSTQTNYETNLRASLLTDLRDLLLGPVPSTAAADVLAQKAQDSYKAIVNQDWAQFEGNKLSCYLGRLGGYKAALVDLTQTRQALAKALDVVASANWPKSDPQLLPSQKNAKLTATVSCSNLITADSAMDAVTVVLTYKDVPRASVTAGVLATLTRKQVIGTEAINTGTSSAPAFKNVFAVTDSAPAQAIPFSFFNLRLKYWRISNRILTGNLSGGIGVNPNSGTKEVEFFTGPGLGIGNFYLHFGAHIGVIKNLSGGFTIGGTVPDKFPSTLPIEKSYTVRPSFAISYRIPLP